MQSINEIEVKINGEPYILKLTFQGVLEMESRSGLTLAGLVNRFASAMAGLNDVTAVVYGGLLGANDNKPPSLTFDQLGQKIFEGGMREMFTPCARMVGAAYSGKPIGNIGVGEDKKKKEEAPKT